MYTLNGLNLTVKYNSDSPAESRDLTPNTGQMNVSTYSYPTGSCWFSASAYGVGFPNNSPGPNKTALGVGLFFMFAVIILAIYGGYVYWKKKKAAGYAGPTQTQSSTASNFQSPQSQKSEASALASPSIVPPTSPSYSAAPTSPQNNGGKKSGMILRNLIIILILKVEQANGTNLLVGLIKKNVENFVIDSCKPIRIVK